MREIRVHLTDQTPRRVAARIEASVRVLLAHTDPRYLAGLGSVVLRDSGGLTREERKRRQHKKGQRILGTYYARQGGDPAFVVLFIDAIHANSNRLLMRFAFTRNSIVAQVLFHEIGHHVAAFVAPEHGSSEGRAEQWMVRLSREYLHRRYGKLRLAVFKVLARGLQAILPRRRRKRPT